MQCYTELTPPTAVSHSLVLPLLSPASSNLVVAKASLLQIFRFTTVSTEVDVSTNGQSQADDAYINVSERSAVTGDAFDLSFIGTDSVILRSEQSRSTKLVLVTEYTLSGTVISMVRVKTQGSKSGGESILIAFRDAKLSLVEWDPERDGLSTTSLHYYEQEDLAGAPWAPAVGDCVNYLAADPSSRCAAFKFGTRNLAILPFKQGDDDTTMNDWDEELDGPRPESKSDGIKTDGETVGNDSVYNPSFVLRFSSLDPTLVNPIHLAFLYEYREPTFGIISSTKYPSASLLHERKDCLSYSVFTLDIHQRASTTILAVNGLPHDLSSIVAVPAPVGGALLLGDNEIIHIDQSGKSNGVAVNSFAKQCTSFSLADQADLELRLEGCMVIPLNVELGDMMLITAAGSLYLVRLRLDGRSVSGISVRSVGDDCGGRTTISQPSCVSTMTSDSIFIGSEATDSHVVGWSRKSGQSMKKKVQPISTYNADQDMDDYIEDNDDEDDDDLYGETPSKPSLPVNGMQPDTGNTNQGDYVFRTHDSLFSIAPLHDITFGKPYGGLSKGPTELVGNIQVVATCGSAQSSSLAVLKCEIEPSVIGRFDFAEARALWTIRAFKPVAKALQNDKTEQLKNRDEDPQAQFDRLMIVSQITRNGGEESSVYALTSAGFEALTGTEFEPAAGTTIEAGTLGHGMRVIQVLRSEVRSYDGDLGLAQILPMFDEETGAEPKIVGASIKDPYILLLRDDASIYVAHCDKENELEELEREDDVLLSTKWLSGCLYDDKSGMFTFHEDVATKDATSIVMFLLSTEGALHVYALPDLSKPIYVAQGICFIPPTISPEFVIRRATARETLTEILVADLGDATFVSPYLVLRAANDDVTIYSPFRRPSKEPLPLMQALHFAKINNAHMAKNSELAADITAKDSDYAYNSSMRAIADLHGYACVFLPGASASFVIKSSKSMPRMINLRGHSVRGLSSFHTAGCDRGFIYVDVEGTARVSQLPEDTNFELGLPIRKVSLGQETRCLTYHEGSDSYVVATSTLEPFELPKDDDHHREWQTEEASFMPLAERGSLRLLTAKTWSVIDTFEMDPCEVIMCIKTLSLEISEDTHERATLVTVGTAICRGEDLPVRGRVYVFDIVNVVPEPDRPETNKKLKLIAKEEIPRGAVTAISEIGTQGFMLVAQGQKCMVRGLKEDGTLLPVAFMDMQTYVTSVKELSGTGLCVMADALKGVWLAGYTEEPYRMMLFGKQTQNMEVLLADILPIGQQLYIIAADFDCNLHVLQYDPEHPKSLHGMILLHRASFALGHTPSTMRLLPRTKATTVLSASDMDVAEEETIPSHEILMTSTSGVLSLLSPLSEAQYRRMSTLVTHLSNMLYHACGLNPKAYRTVGDAPEAVIGGRPIVDGTMLMRWNELGSQRRVEVAGRIGVDVDQVREDLEFLKGGLLYL